MLGRSGRWDMEIVIDMSSRANGRSELAIKSQTCSRAGILSLLFLSSPSPLSRGCFPMQPCQKSSRRTGDCVARGERRGVDPGGSLDALGEVVERILDILDRGGRRGCKGDVEFLEVTD